MLNISGKDNIVDHKNVDYPNEIVIKMNAFIFFTIEKNLGNKNEVIFYHIYYSFWYIVYFRNL